MVEKVINLLSASTTAGALTAEHIIINLVFALIFGVFIQLVYTKTHRGAISSSFLLTLLLITVIAAAAMMIIGNNLVAAFGLVGAFSIIRFRTVVKDTSDIAFVFLALISGMGAGTRSYAVVLFTNCIVALIMLLVRYFWVKDEPDKYILILAFSPKKSEVDAVLKKFFSSVKLLEGMAKQGVVGGEFHYDVEFKKDARPEDFLREMKRVSGADYIRLLPSSVRASY